MFNITYLFKLRAACTFWEGEDPSIKFRIKKYRTDSFFQVLEDVSTYVEKTDKNFYCVKQVSVGSQIHINKT